MAEYKAIAFTGPSGSGKTTLIEKISNILSPYRKIAIIKHDPRNKALFDQEGKDSDRFYKTGAEVAVVSDDRTTLFSHRKHKISEISLMFGDFDLLMVEGLRTLPLPRIGVFRGKVEKDYLPHIKAIAIDDSIDLKDHTIPSSITILNLNDTKSIIAWIDKNSTRLGKETIDADDL